MYFFGCSCDVGTVSDYLFLFAWEVRFIIVVVVAIEAGAAQALLTLKG